MVDENANDKQERRFIDPVTGATRGSSSASSITGAGSEPDKEPSNKATTGEKPTTQNVQTSQGEPGTNLGGRGPGASSKTIGDQDSTQARNDMDMVDPMTSRAPDKIKPEGV